MFAKIFALLAVVAVALAAPAPKPAPAPQLPVYTAGLDYAYPGVVPSVYSAYPAPVAYTGYSGYPAVYYR